MILRLIFLFFFIFQYALAQQNKEFISVKAHFDTQRQLLTNEFKKRSEKLPPEGQTAMRYQFTEFMVKLDSIQNAALVGALITIKNHEELSAHQHFSGTLSNLKTEFVNSEEAPEYPGGINTLRNQLIELFFFDSSTAENILKTMITFVVERDGYITNVIAEGENPNFNRQAMIAVYLLPEKFKPAKINGEPVRYRYRLPLTLNFE